MVKFIRLAGLIFGSVLVLGAVGVSTASANAIKCYKVDKGKGNYKNSTCTEKVGALEGEFVLAELIEFVEKELWCAKIAPVGSKTGTFESGTCKKELTNGEYTTVIAPKLGLPVVAINVLSGETGSTVAKGSVTGATTLESTNGSKLTGKGVTLTTTFAASGSKGTFTADFTNVEESAGKPCSTAGDASGTVLTTGNFQVVPLGSTLELLFEPKEVEITCTKGETKTKVLVKGVVISTFVALLNTEITTFSGALEGSAGKNKLTEYENDGGTKVTGQFLKTKFSSGTEAQSDEVVAEPLTSTIEGGKMVTVED